MSIASFFAGAGGMDVGFNNAGFKIIWANEFDKGIYPTYQSNHPLTILDTRSIFDIKSSDVPNIDGIIGGPPCQSWSSAGCNKGTMDIRGQAFIDFIRILNDKNPKFFVIENVEGLTRSTHAKSFALILHDLEKCGSGFTLSYKVLNASDYSVPQDRLRLFIVGIRKEFGITFKFPDVHINKVSLRDIIWDLRDKAVAYKSYVCSDNNAYLDSDWSSNFMSRNRVRGWDECSFTIPASVRHVTIHPQAPKMIKHSIDKFIFVPGMEHLYRRFTINECARIQTFPDNYFKFDNLSMAYKMIGNAVPCKLAEAVAKALYQQINGKLQILPKKKFQIIKKL